MELERGKLKGGSCGGGVYHLGSSSFNVCNTIEIGIREGLCKCFLMMMMMRRRTTMMMMTTMVRENDDDDVKDDDDDDDDDRAGHGHSYVKDDRHHDVKMVRHGKRNLAFKPQFTYTVV